MPQVTVNIAGKSYRMACADGEETHLDGLARLLDGRIAEMREAFGEIGDMRLQVMAALTLADELGEARSRTARLEAEIAELKGIVANGDARAHDSETRLADAIVKASERIERLARNLNAASSSAMPGQNAMSGRATGARNQGDRDAAGGGHGERDPG
ncbi:cell division protein ZapA [Saliniramus sp.]|uniref:cell division protein ZapA n=1 Tax=Saliniramus sp. TaxID=2986772 RepID=UPI0039C900DC